MTKRKKGQKTITKHYTEN